MGQSKNQKIMNNYNNKIQQPKKKINPNFIHGTLSCDSCFIQPIVGIRYHSSLHSDYDLCSSCHEKKEYGDYKDMVFEQVQLDCHMNYNNKNKNKNKNNNNISESINNTKTAINGTLDVGKEGIFVSLMANHCQSSSDRSLVLAILERTLQKFDAEIEVKVEVSSSSKVEQQ